MAATGLTLLSIGTFEGTLCKDYIKSMENKTKNTNSISVK